MTYTYRDGCLKLICDDGLDKEMDEIEDKLDAALWAINNVKVGGKYYYVWWRAIGKLNQRKFDTKCAIEWRQKSYERKKALQISIQRNHSSNGGLERS